MRRYIHHYKKESDFRKDYYSEDKYKSPWTSYVDRKGRWEAYPVNYNKSAAAAAPRGLWLDMFPDGTVETSYSCDIYQTPYDPDFCECFYEYDTFDDYVDNYLNQQIPSGGNDCGNYWEYINDFEFQGNEYFMYGLVVDWSDTPIYYGLLPKIYTIEQLQGLSMEENIYN